jgi:hypothetical protein
MAGSSPASFIGGVKRRMRAPIILWSKQIAEEACIWLKEPKSAPQGLNRLRKNSGFGEKSAYSVLPGLKPALILMALCGG